MPASSNEPEAEYDSIWYDGPDLSIDAISMLLMIAEYMQLPMHVPERVRAARIVKGEELEI